MRYISRFYISRAQRVAGKNEQPNPTTTARGQMQLHRLHRLEADPCWADHFWW